ncbi:thiamine phosphate synthase [Massilia norwichensis]|uniref:Thiamine-phosphate synthase n=1 Tax=Massilia norwichensis TaxID=1442366 RepID=A0ABT2A1R0_9BURK|nr:thiamine phosphate synthase [Massilia norwichensis]MCS0588131.1 thiamine phosphate synthase [Massilia norwichensis]
MKIDMKGLYLVTPDWDDTARLLEVTNRALEAGAALVQYRNKTASDALRREQAAALLALCRQHDRPLIINDHVDLCLQLGADGVHVGGLDAPVAAVRAALGPDKIVGASCYGQLALARSAQDAGASYVAFGGFYPSKVKVYEVSTPPGIVAQAKGQLTVPVVVIGGMTVANARPLVESGADLVAAISSVYLAEDASAAVREFAAMFR